MEQNAELILYGVDDIVPGTQLIWVEGECFPPDTEVMTTTGWKAIESLAKDDLVLQCNSDLSGEFVKPITYVKQIFTGFLIKHSSVGYVSITTPNHNLVSEYNGKVKKHPACEIQKSYWNIPRVCHVEGNGIDLTDDQIRLCLAISADCTVEDRKGTGNLKPKEKRYARATFKKERKIKRFRNLLTNCEIDFKESIHPSHTDSTAFCFPVPDWVCGRNLPNEWLIAATHEQRLMMLEELVHWDGNHVPNRRQKEFCSSLKHNADWVQTLAHTTGMVSSIMKKKIKSAKHKQSYKVSILYGKDHSNWTSVQTSLVPHDGPVYCVTVPSGMILVRQENKITVTGNCDKLAYEEIGIQECVSVPNGAGTKDFSFLESVENLLGTVSSHVLSLDNDAPGKSLTNELIRRLGPEKCWTVSYPEGCKDANDVLMKLGPDALKEVLLKAVPVPIEGLVSVEDIADLLKEKYNAPRPRGAEIGFQISKLYRPRTKAVTIITGIPSSGKSAWLNWFLVQLAWKHEWPVCFFSPEAESVDEHVRYMLQTFTKKPFYGNSEYRMTEEERDFGMEWLGQYFSFIHMDRLPPLDEIISITKAAIYRYGIKGLVIDPWNELDSYIPKNLTQTEYINLCLAKLRKFARLHDIHIWIIAHPRIMRKSPGGSIDTVTPYDINGSAAWYNKGDFCLCVERDKSEPETPVKVFVQKVRFQGDGDLGSIEMRYDRYTGNYYDLVDFHFNEELD